MERVRKLWLTFATALLLGIVSAWVAAQVALSSGCLDCPKDYSNNQQRCRECCGLRCSDPGEWEQCTFACRGYKT